jgi:hypothetical protein
MVQNIDGQTNILEPKCPSIMVNQDSTLRLPAFHGCEETMKNGIGLCAKLYDM